MELIIKQINAEETRKILPDILAIRHEYFKEWPYQIDDLNGHLFFVYEETLKKDFVCYLFYDADKLVGCVTGHNEPQTDFSKDYTNYLYLGWVSIKKDYLNKGVFTTALKQIQSDAVEKGYSGTKFIVIDAEKDGYQPLDYFKSVGYNEIEDEPFDLDGTKYWKVVWTNEV